MVSQGETIFLHTDTIAALETCQLEGIADQLPHHVSRPGTGLSSPADPQQSAATPFQFHRSTLGIQLPHFVEEDT